MEKQPMRLIILSVVATLLLTGCAVKGSFVDVENRPAGQLVDAEADMIAHVYADRRTPQHWDELKRRGLVRDRFRDAIDRRLVQVGMNVTEVRASQGLLAEKSRTTTAAGEFIQWQSLRTCDSFACRAMTIMLTKDVYTQNGIVVVVRD
jgi:hypothetical protein